MNILSPNLAFIWMVCIKVSVYRRAFIFAKNYVLEDFSIGKILSIVEMFSRERKAKKREVIKRKSVMLLFQVGICIYSLPSIFSSLHSFPLLLFPFFVLFCCCFSSLLSFSSSFSWRGTGGTQEGDRPI